MLPLVPTPLIRLGNLFPGREVYAKCEFLAPSGCFKIRGAVHLLDRLCQEGRKPHLIVPSMGNTALGAAVAAQAFGVKMTGVVPTTISRAKDEKLKALGVELVKIAGGGSDLLRHATQLAKENGGYFVHPHLDPLWTDGYRTIATEIFDVLPVCHSLVFPLGGGGLLMGIFSYLRDNPRPFQEDLHVRDADSKILATFGKRPPRLYACEPQNYPKYAKVGHARTKTMADGLLLENPHPAVKEAIDKSGISVPLVPEKDIGLALRQLFETQGLVVEPSSAVPMAYVKSHWADLEDPICVILTGENITREDHRKIVADAKED